MAPYQLSCFNPIKLLNISKSKSKEEEIKETRSIASYK